MPVKRWRSSGPMTLNNYTLEELEYLRKVTTMDDTKIKYICWIQEVGECGTPHLQIYAQATEKLSVAAWHKQLGPRIGNIVPTQNVKAAIEYCKGLQNGQPKAGSDLSTIEEYGKAPNQGCRNDLIYATNEIRKRSLKEIMIEGSEYEPTIMQYFAYFKELDIVCKAHRNFELARQQHNEFMATRVKAPWEYKLMEVVNSNEDTRAIHWFYDESGEVGKTVNAKDLHYNHNAFYCTGGKAVDIAHAYDYEPIVVFNLVASVDETTMTYLYKVLEEFKDGIFSSGKYKSVTKAFVIPKVIVFSNMRPDDSKMKKNRLKVYNIITL